MRLLLPLEVSEKLVIALSKAGRREIGGILMGEHIADNVFRVRALTIQQRSGTVATFIRAVQGIIEPLRKFFQATNNDFTRFNYLGEWHSHPSFMPEPSGTDHQTIRDIIEDPHVGANFVVLMVVKLSLSRQLEGTVTVYQPEGKEFKGQLVLETQL